MRINIIVDMDKLNVMTVMEKLKGEFDCKN